MILSRKISHFLSVVEYGSFKNASKSIHISSPALCKSIADIEEVLGFKLFNRSNTGVTLTEEGVNLYKYLLPICDNVENIKSIFLQKCKKKEVKVGIDSYNKLFKELTNKITENGQVDFISEICNFEDHCSKLLSGELDIFISTHPPIEDELERISYKKYKNETYLFVFSKEIMSKNKSLDNIMRNEKVVLHSEMKNHPLFYALSKYRTDHKIKNQMLIIPDINHIMELVFLGVGYSIINSSTVNTRYLKVNDLEFIHNALFTSNVFSYIYYLKRKELELKEFIINFLEC
ncbi:LysR family transcriptional regulator [Xenorhabdus szentirmaii]|uniref:LysR family transcriptional regulator n=1 Tax=Xenorhabdus szentirmaii TaxID=290112 RepID=UPI00199EC573|nr:LysR family transcriptional regulator [Xenorhabdus sp. CUL]MBD2791988.1 LysR family transcriptional regulator [Xenorhabdus sp. CUL]